MRIYNAPTLIEVEPLLDRYKVRYVLVGDVEHEEHGTSLDKFAGLQEVFRSGNTVIYKR
jgi:uncharacterized membrane protein